MLIKNEKWHASRKPGYGDTKLEPLIGHSVKLAGPKRWVLDHSYMIEVVHDRTPVENAVATWTLKDETYCVHAGDFTAEWEAAEVIPGFHRVDNARGLYSLGENLVCKVKSWMPGKPDEAKNMEFVRNHAPDVPMPPVYFSWIDEEWERSFIVMERIPGRTLQEAWNDLSVPQVYRIAKETIQYMIKLAEAAHSPELASLNGGGNTEPWLTGTTPGFEKFPSWLYPLAHPKLNATQLHRHLSQTGFIQKAIKSGFDTKWLEDEKFPMAHTDLSPTNIIIADIDEANTNDGPLVKALLDWEIAGFFPLWWTWWKTKICPAFVLEHVEWPCPPNKDPWVWRDLLIAGMHRYHVGTFPELEIDRTEFFEKMSNDA